MSATLSHALSLNHVSKHYGRVAAVDDVSLRVERGRFLTLLGPSGSGKTTLLMMIAGFVAPSGGEILLDQTPITALLPERRNFGMVFQGYALFPHLTVAENVAFPLKIRRRPRGEITARVKAALDLVQLSGLAGRMPRQLSGGQQQRAALARALVFEPHLLLLDEPLSALDKNLRSDMQIELKRLHERIGLTFIYVTHDQQEALSMSDEIAILRDGKLVQQGSPRDLYERPTGRFVAGFLGRSNFLSGTVESVTPTALAYRCGGVRLLQAGGGPAAGAAILVTVRPEKIRLVSADDPPANRLTGQVAGWSYFGDAFHVQVDIPAIGTIALSTPTWRQAQPVTGSTVEIGWDADASFPVAEDAPA